MGAGFAYKLVRNVTTEVVTDVQNVKATIAPIQAAASKASGNPAAASPMAPEPKGLSMPARLHVIYKETPQRPILLSNVSRMR
jgi:hypothetical protein